MVAALRENRTELARAERERAWQEMARQVAHEIKNPLTPMQLSAQFLRRAYDEGAADLDEVLRECTDAIVEQVEGLRRIANEFSAYARLPVVRREPTNLNAPLEEALTLFEPAMPDGIEVIRELAGDMPSALLDSEQIRRVAINLIRNAVDAMGEEGTLTVRSGWNEEGVWLQVSDTGEGIAPEVQERLFEPYFSTKTDGTGLGLAITRSIVDAYGGTLTVDSRPEEGTSMTAQFPFE
jgi:two-component system nitrogen regulation sensor histidine kinase NtrY